ncbi:LOW QUALITY PROTEIN: fermitin family homolog 3-like [Podargus strigoides]
MAGLKTASGETIDGSFELQVEVEEGDAVGQGDPTAPPGPPQPSAPSPSASPGTSTSGGSCCSSWRAWFPFDPLPPDPLPPDPLPPDLVSLGPGAPLTRCPLTRCPLTRFPLDPVPPDLVPPDPVPLGPAAPLTQCPLTRFPPDPLPLTRFPFDPRRTWLLRPGRALEALGVGAEARLRFAPQHRPLLLRLPNRRRLRLRLSFARPVAAAVQRACGVLGAGSGVRGAGCGVLGAGCWAMSPSPRCPPTATGCSWPLGGGWAPPPPPRPPRGSPLLRRTRLHARWLDPWRSLLEQDVRDDEELLLRFKYLCIHDLDPQRDELRLALLYEQGRWAVLSEELDCTEEEMMLFAALQYHIDEVGGSGEPGGGRWGRGPGRPGRSSQQPEVKLGGEAEPPGPLEELSPIPELAEELEMYRPRKLALRGFRPTWAVLKETTLMYGRSPPTAGGEPLQQLNLRGCEVTPDVDVGTQKFGIKLLVATPEGMSEIQLRCRGAPQYARWVTGCRLASRRGGPSLPPTAPGAPPHRAPPNPRVLLAPRFQRKVKAKQLGPRVLELLHRLGALTPAQARLRFLEAWRALPGFGLAYFLVRFKGSRREEVLGVTGSTGGSLGALGPPGSRAAGGRRCWGSLGALGGHWEHWVPQVQGQPAGGGGSRREEVLGVGPSRLLRMEAGGGGAVTRAWRYSALRQWDINWDSQQVTLELEGELFQKLTGGQEPL